jgi:cation diffusion facilitator family transporter
MWSKKEKVAAVSVLASGSLAAAKFVVGVIIGSLALISDALHSLIDLGATLVTWFAVRVADRPPDAEHHYGHGKVESVAALGATVLLFLLAGGVAVEGVQRLLQGGSTPIFSVVPFVVLAIEMVVNGWRAHVLRKTARETGSQALEADALHFASDLYGSVAVMIGLAFAAYGYSWGDPLAAIAVAVIISFLGVRMGRRTIEALIDTAPLGVTERVGKLMGSVPGVVRIDRLRVRSVGPCNFVEATVAVPRTMPLDRLKALKEALQQKVAADLGVCDVTITTNPVALDNESVQDRIMVIARNHAVAVHHLTVHAIGDKLSVALDVEVDGALPLGRAHEIATKLERAIGAELGADVEIETHIEPLQARRLAGREAPASRVAEVSAVLTELATGHPILRDVHDVRVRETPEGELVIFHCTVDPLCTVFDVHREVDELERGLKQRFPAIRRVIGHAEPRDHVTTILPEVVEL